MASSSAHLRLISLTREMLGPEANRDGAVDSPPSDLEPRRSVSVQAHLDGPHGPELRAIANRFHTAKAAAVVNELDAIAPTPGAWVDALPLPATRRPPPNASVFSLLGYLVRLWWARWSNQSERAERRALGPVWPDDTGDDHRCARTSPIAVTRC